LRRKKGLKSTDDMNNKVALFFGNYQFSWLLAMNLVSLYHLFDQLPFAVIKGYQSLLSFNIISLFLVIFKQSLSKGPTVAIPGPFFVPAYLIYKNTASSFPHQVNE
jgi:hypothetical protein